MNKLRSSLSMSLDGYVAGPNQSVDDPLGIGGEQLHQWLFPLEAFRESHGAADGEVNASTPVAEAILGGTGATVMGRNMFGGDLAGPHLSRRWHPPLPGTGGPRARARSGRSDRRAP